MIKKQNLCQVCAKPLPEGAKKCTECGEYQNMFLRIVAGMDLKGLIALVPIVTLSFVFIQERIEKKESELHVALVSCEKDKINLFMSNVGNRAAIIGDANYSVAKEQARPLKMSLSTDARLIEGGETRAIELSVDRKISPGGFVPHNVKKLKECKITVLINTIAFDHEVKPQVVVCDCPN